MIKDKTSDLMLVAPPKALPPTVLIPEAPCAAAVRCSFFVCSVMNLHSTHQITGPYINGFLTCSI